MLDIATCPHQFEFGDISFIQGHRFSTGGSWTPKRSHLNLFKQVFRGPSVIPIDTVGVNRNFYDFQGSMEQKG